MTIKLTKASARYIRKKIATGEFASPSAVVNYALKVLERLERDEAREQKIQRRLIDEGLRDTKAGRVVDWNPRELKRSLKKLLSGSPRKRGERGRFRSAGWARSLVTNSASHITSSHNAASHPPAHA